MLDIRLVIIFTLICLVYIIVQIIKLFKILSQYLKQRKFKNKVFVEPYMWEQVLDIIIAIIAIVFTFSMAGML